MEMIKPHSISEKLLSIRIFAPSFVLLGLVGLYLSTIVTNPYTRLYPLALILGTILYIANRSRFSPGDFIEVPTIWVKITLIAYFLIISGLIIAFQSAGFFRSNTVFHLTFALYLTTGILVWCRPNPAFSLGILCTTGAVNRLTAYYASALYVGNDYYAHYNWIQGIISEGSLTPIIDDKYYYAPFYHLLTAESGQILGVSIEHAGAFVTPMLITIVPALVIYSLVRTQWTKRAGAMGAFLWMASDYAIYHGHYAVTTSLAVVVFSLILLTIFKYKQTYRVLFGLLCIIFIGVMSAVHQVGLFIAVVFVTFYLIGRLIFTLKLNRDIILLPLIGGAVLFTDFMITRRGGPVGERSFLESYLGLVISRFPTAGVESRQEASLPPNNSFTGIGAAGLDTIQLAGAFMLLSIAIAGALFYLFSTRSGSHQHTALTFGMPIAAMYGIALGFPIIGIGDLLPTRWFPFIYILLAVMAAPFFVVFVQSITKPLGKYHMVATLVVLIGIIGPFIVLMGGNHVGASDDPYLDNAAGAERFGVTESEEAIYSHTSTYAASDDVLTDRRAATIFTRYYGLQPNVLEFEYWNADTLQHGMIVEREYIHTDQSQYRLEYEDILHEVSGPFPMSELETTKKSTVYDNGEDQLIRYGDSEE